MSGSVKENDFLSVVNDNIRSDVLSDSASLMSCYAGMPYIVEQRCLAVINVSHYGNDRRTFIFERLFLLRL